MAAEPKHRLYLSVVLSVLVGVGIGLVLGWVVWPVSWHDTDPSDLRLQHQLAYISMTADSLAVTGDVTTAEWRLYELMDEDTPWQGVAQLVLDASEARREVGDDVGAQRVLQMAEQLDIPQPVAQAGEAAPAIPLAAPKMLLYGSAVVLTLAALAMLVWFFGEMSKQRGLNLSPAALAQGVAAALKRGNRAGPRSVNGAAQGSRSAKVARSAKGKARPSAPAPRRFPKLPPEAAPPHAEASSVAPVAEAEAEPTVNEAEAEGPAEVDTIEPLADVGFALEAVETLDEAGLEAEVEDAAADVGVEIEAVEALADTGVGFDAVELVEAEETRAEAEEPPADTNAVAEPVEGGTDTAVDYGTAGTDDAKGDIRDLLTADYVEAEGDDVDLVVSPFEAPVSRELAEEPTGSAPVIVEDFEPDAFGVFEVEYDHEDDDFDCSFSIESPERGFLGECGIGVADVLLDDGPQRVDAFDVWLFDKSDIRTVSKILVSEYVYHDPALNAKLSAKGELVLAEPGATITLETLSLRVTAMVRSFSYDEDYRIPNCCFSHLEVHVVAESSDTIP